jgi:hypothetical protein
MFEPNGSSRLEMSNRSLEIPRRVTVEVSKMRAHKMGRKEDDSVDAICTSLELRPTAAVPSNYEMRYDSLLAMAKW